MLRLSPPSESLILLVIQEGKSGNSRFRASEEFGGREGVCARVRVRVHGGWVVGWLWATGREAAIHAKWSQLPLV